MAGLIERVKAWVRPSEAGSDEIAEYALSRREPDPESRLRVYAEPVDPEEVAAEVALPPGVYLLHEIKASGMAGAVVWEERLEATAAEE